MIAQLLTTILHLSVTECMKLLFINEYWLKL